jgi:hypothetical protein
MNQSIQSRAVRRVTRLAAVALVVAAGAVHADNEATQDISIAVSSVNEIEVGIGSVAINVSTATAGSTPSGTGSSTYAITTNATASKKITAALVSALASGLTLSTNLQAPSTGSSAGVTGLSTTAADVVTSIEAVAQSGLTIDYAATATIAVASGSYDADVIYTLVDN